MKNFKPIVLLAALLFMITLMVPTLLVLPFGEEHASGKLGENVKDSQLRESYIID